MPAPLRVVLTPGDDVLRPGPDLLVASRTAVLFRRASRLHEPHLPAVGSGRDDIRRAQRLGSITGRGGPAAPLLRPRPTRH